MYNVDGDGILTDRNHNNQEWTTHGFSREFHDGKVIIFIEKSREGWDVYYEYASNRGYPYHVAEGIPLHRAFERAGDYANRATEDKNNVHSSFSSLPDSE